MKNLTPSDLVTKQQKATKIIAKVLPFASMGLMLAAALTPAFADYKATVQTLINNIINIVCFVVVGIGVFMVIWGVVGMIMAAKQEDTNAQTQASQKLMVGIALVALPIAIKALKLDQLIMDQFDEISTGTSAGGGSGSN